MRTIHLIAITLLLLFGACTNQPGDTAKDTRPVIVNPDGSMLKRTFRKNGTILSECTIKNNKRNGPAKNYYENGKVSYEFYYVNDKREGDVKWLFSDGKICTITPYKNDKRQGLGKRYYRSGKIAAETPYDKGEVEPGLKEYTENGKLVNYNPSLQIKAIDKTATQHKYILQLTMSDNTGSVRYFIIKDDGSKVKRQEIPSKNGVGTMTFSVSQPNFKTGKILFEAQVITKYGNTYVCRKAYWK